LVHGFRGFSPALAGWLDLSLGPEVRQDVLVAGAHGKGCSLVAATKLEEGDRQGQVTRYIFQRCCPMTYFLQLKPHLPTAPQF
jgi:hypothetical protein